MATQGKWSRVFVLSVVCMSLVLLSVIGVWLYTSNQQIAQKNRELEQQKQLKEYEQQQINQRADKERQCEAHQDSSNPFLHSSAC